MSLKEVAVVSLALSVPVSPSDIQSYTFRNIYIFPQFMGYIYLANLGASRTTHWSSHAFLSLSG